MSPLVILPAEKPHLLPPFPTCSDCWFGDYLIDKPGQNPQTTRVLRGLVLFPEHAWTHAEVCWGLAFGDGTSSLPLLLFYKNHRVEWLRRVRVRFRSPLLRGRTLPSYLSFPLLLHEMFPGWYNHTLCGADTEICCMKALTARQEQQVISPARWALKPFLCHGRKLFLTNGW